MKVLPISEETSLRTYTYYSYLDAMLHNEYRTGDIRAKLRILDYNKYEWNFLGDKLRMELQDGSCMFIREGGSTALNGILFRELMEQDKIELEILYQQYSQPWGRISIFISEEEAPEMTSPFLYQIGNFCKTGCFVKDRRGNQINTNRKLLSGERLVLKREGERLALGCRTGDTGDFFALYECELEKQSDMDSFKIGIGVFLYDNVYYEWLYANHLQWRYHKQYRDISFEFESSIERNWNYYIVNYFVTYKTETLKMIRELKVEIKENYVAILHREFKPKTVKRKIASLKALFHYLKYEEILAVNPFDRLRVKFREPVILPKTIPLFAVEAILMKMYQDYTLAETVYRKQTVLREIAVIELLFATGMRISELCALKPEDVDLQDRTILIYGKGAKERRIQIGSEAVFEILKTYCNEYREVMQKGEHFFVNQSGSPISDQAIRRMINRYAKRAEVELHITPHMFRHTFATSLMEADVDIRYIQEMLGYSSIHITEIYTHVTMAKQRDILVTKHPRSRFRI